MIPNSRSVSAGLIVVLILAIVSPFLFAIRYSGFSGLTVRLQGLFWFFDNQPPHIRFGINGLWDVIQYFPFVSLRPLGVYQMYRYYRQRASSFSLFVIGLLGEVPPLIAASSLIPLLITSMYVGPLPIHMMAGYIIIKLRPRPQISKPWQDMPNPQLIDKAGIERLG